MIDERFNGGGLAADYIVDYLRRPLLSYFSTREGQDIDDPGGRHLRAQGDDHQRVGRLRRRRPALVLPPAELGPLVGKRTWGGLVGIGGYPPLIDGGAVTAPRVAFWNPEGEWEVENHGVAPDVEVDLDPQLWRQGQDPQLEKAVEVALKLLEENPLPKAKRPEFPNYHAKEGAGTQ